MRTEERCETVAKVVKSEPARIVLHQSPAVIPMRGKNSSLIRGGPQIIFDEHIRYPRLLAFQSKGSKDPVAWLRIGGLLFPAKHEFGQQKTPTWSRGVADVDFAVVATPEDTETEIGLVVRLRGYFLLD